MGPARLFSLGSEPGPVLEVLDLGATVHRLWVTGGDGVRRNVLLGHPAAEDHLRSPDYLGSTVGRYANRIADGRFPLGDRMVQVATNDRGNTLHGGPDGFDRRLWRAVDDAEDSLTLQLESPDGDQGFPGTLLVTARFEVSADTVSLRLTATTDAETVVNLTSHAYFNLDGEGAGTIEDHRLQVHASAYLPVDDTGIPLGPEVPVAGAPFDLRSAARLGDRIHADDPQLEAAGGFDHSFVLGQVEARQACPGSRVVATLESSTSRTRLELSTDQPGLQVYTGNALDGSGPATGGGTNRRWAGVALEPQLLPNTPNRTNAAAALLAPGQTYTAALDWRFGALPDTPDAAARG